MCCIGWDPHTQLESDLNSGSKVLTILYHVCANSISCCFRKMSLKKEGAEQKAVRVEGHTKLTHKKLSFRETFALGFG